jgi:hypothetical protein
MAKTLEPNMHGPYIASAAAGDESHKISSIIHHQQRPAPGNRISQMSFVSEKRPPEQKEELTQSWYLVLLSYGEEDAADNESRSVHTNGDQLAFDAGKVCERKIPYTSSLAGPKGKAQKRLPCLHARRWPIMCVIFSALLAVGKSSKK